MLHGVICDHLSTLLLLHVCEHVAHGRLGLSKLGLQHLAQDGSHGVEVLLAMIAGAVATKAV